MSGSRKDDHLALAARQQREAHGEPPQPTDATSQAPDDASSVSSPRPAGSDSTYCAWDDVRILHHSLAGIDPGQADISTNIPTDRSGRNTSSGVHTAQPLHWGLPFYINGMTGGSELTAGVNRVLAETAARTGIAVATGSMSIFLREPDTLPTFRILRDRNPHGTVWANLSADATPDDAARVVDALQADALQIHVNAVQETVMPEGSRGYASWPRNIEAIVNALEVTHTPVIVKEVGFGMTRAYPSPTSPAAEEPTSRASKMTDDPTGISRTSPGSDNPPHSPFSTRPPRTSTRCPHSSLQAEFGNPTTSSEVSPSELTPWASLERSFTPR